MADEHLVFTPGNPVPVCRDCRQPMVQRLHEGSGLLQWRCVNDQCWLSK